MQSLSTDQSRLSMLLCLSNTCVLEKEWLKALLVVNFSINHFDILPTVFTTWLCCACYTRDMHTSAFIHTCIGWWLWLLFLLGHRQNVTVLRINQFDVKPNIEWSVYYNIVSCNCNYSYCVYYNYYWNYYVIIIVV